jgi:hypothetical protein
MSDDTEVKELLKALLEQSRPPKPPPYHNEYVQYQKPPPPMSIDRTNTALSIAGHVKGYIGGFIAITVTVTMFYMNTENTFGNIDSRLTTLEDNQKKYVQLEEDIEDLHDSIVSLRNELRRLDDKFEPYNQYRESPKSDGEKQSYSYLYWKTPKMGKL